MAEMDYAMTILYLFLLHLCVCLYVCVCVSVYTHKVIKPSLLTSLNQPCTALAHSFPSLPSAMHLVLAWSPSPYSEGFNCALVLLDLILKASV